MTRILFVDDSVERVAMFLKSMPQDVQVIVVRDAGCAIDAIESMCPNVVFLDHDLGGEVFVDQDPNGNTGTAIVKFIIERGQFHPLLKRIICHSMNGSARIAMVRALEAENRWEVWNSPFIMWDWRELHNAWENLPEN